MKPVAWCARLHHLLMNIPEQILDTTVAVEDVIADLERAIIRANAAVIRKPAREIHAASPELFELSLALVRASKAASEAKAGLLTAIKMPLSTTLVGTLSVR